MLVRERNLDGKVITREYDLDKSYKELTNEIFELKNEIANLELTLSLVSHKQLSAVRTEDLIWELTSRMNTNIKKAEKYDNLVVKHRKAAALIAELKSRVGED